MKRSLLRASALSLALLTMLPAALTGCNPATGNTDTTVDTVAPTDAPTESLPIETETTEPDAFENTILLAADGQTAYTLIVPDYAAAWELDAAERLTKTFAELGVSITTAVDTATEAGTKEIVVGYTNRNSELAADFFDVGVLGYHVANLGYTLVKDTRTGCETSNVNAVMDGALDPFIESYLNCLASGNWVQK